MLFYFFITIVFISQLIIAATLIVVLVKIDCKINQINKSINGSRFKIKDICSLTQKISEQLKDLSEIFVEKFEEEKEKITLEVFKSLMSMILFWSINIKVAKRLKKSKILKAAWKGLTLVQNMI